MACLDQNLKAHHIITADGVKNNNFLFNKLPYIGYDLNDWHNIVTLSGIPELAFFYEMALHSGPYPMTYTDKVENELNKILVRIKNTIFAIKLLLMQNS